MNDIIKKVYDMNVNNNINNGVNGGGGGLVSSISGGLNSDDISISNLSNNFKENEIQSSTSQVFLAETFYITTKKNNVFQVKLTEKGLCLRKECNGNAKEQLILSEDIIGCRCLRSKRKAPKSSGCACSSLPGPTNHHLKVVEENSQDLDETDVSAYLYIYAYILKKSRRNGHRRERTTLTLRFRSFDRYEDNNREAQRWRDSIKQLIRGESPLSALKPPDTRKMLIILNPKSGSGKAREVFQQRVAPIYTEAEISYDLHVTKKANFAREFVRNKDIFLWRGIVVVGGDGIFWEVINGVLEREDWEKALETVPIGIIPCGSGNGLARTIAHLYQEPYEPKPILGATLTTVRGNTTPMDLVRVETRTQIMYSFLSVGWGFISDIDIESERFRSIGYQRFALWSVHRLINLRTYAGTLSYLPVNLNDYQQQLSQFNNLGITSNVNLKYRGNGGLLLKHSISCNTALDCPECHGNGDCEICDTGFGDVLSLETTSGMGGIPNGEINGAGGESGGFGTNHGAHFRTRKDSWYSATSRKSAYFSTSESVYQSIADKDSAYGENGENNTNSYVRMFGPASRIPALTTPVPDSWHTETGEYIMIHTAYQTHLGVDCYFAPSAKLNDGIIWLLVIRAGIPRSQLLSFLLGLSSGTHIPNGPHEYIKLIPVTAFRIEPITTSGNLTVDGESVEYGPIQGEIVPGLAKVMVP